MKTGEIIYQSVKDQNHYSSKYNDQFSVQVTSPEILNKKETLNQKISQVVTTGHITGILEEEKKKALGKAIKNGADDDTVKQSIGEINENRRAHAKVVDGLINMQMIPKTCKDMIQDPKGRTLGWKEIEAEMSLPTRNRNPARPIGDALTNALRNRWPRKPEQQ